MDIRTLKAEASRTLLGAAYSPRLLVLIHTGVALGVGLVLALIGDILDHGVSAAGGLSGMSTQAALTTAQVVLQLIGVATMPFWQAGIVSAALKVSRRQQVSPRDLTEGFRRFKPMLSSGIMVGLQYLSMGFVSSYLSSALIVFVPFAAAVYPAVFLLAYAVLAVPVFYRSRMVRYLIMDNPDLGGIRAVLMSGKMMRGRWLRLFKLDLSFWWFYGLELLLGVVSAGNLLLPMLGVALPVSDGVAYWGFQLLAGAGELGLYYLARPKLEVTYALCYEAFLQPEDPKPQKPAVHPWTY